MRLTLAAGVLVGLGMASSLVVAEGTRAPAKAVPELLRRFAAGADARRYAQDETDFTRVLNVRGREVLAQAFLADQNFYRAALAVGGHEDLGPVARVVAPMPGDLTAASPWVTIERQTGQALEKQTVALGFRTVKELGRPDERRLVRVQREYHLIGLGPFTRVKAETFEHLDQIDSLTVQVGDVTGTFRGFGLMLGKILSFRATPEHLYVFTSANVGYQLAITIVDGQMTFTSSRQLGEAGEMLKSQSSKVDARVTCQKDLAEGVG